MQRIAAAGAADRLRCRCIGRNAAQVGQQVGARDPVDHGMVDFQHDRDGVTAGATLQDPHLPEWMIAVQRQPDDVATDVCQFAAASRRRYADAMQMALEPERFVVHPHRVIQVQLVVGELHAKFRHRFDAFSQRCAKPAIRIAARHCRGVQL